MSFIVNLTRMQSPLKATFGFQFYDCIERLISLIATGSYYFIIKQTVGKYQYEEFDVVD